jgi:hypothetical protein
MDIKIAPDKTKVKTKFFDSKAGDKINLDLQGYVKHKNIIQGDPLKGSKIKVRGQYKKGRHSVTGEATYKPDTKEGNIGATYTLSFSEGSKDKTIVKTLDDLLKKTPANRNLRNAKAAKDSGLDVETWSGFLTNKQKQMLGIK